MLKHIEYLQTHDQYFHYSSEKWIEMDRSKGIM